MELICENEGYNGVISLPEGADEEEGEAYENRSFVIEFHKFPFLFVYCDSIVTHYITFVKHLRDFLTFV